MRTSGGTLSSLDCSKNLSSPRLFAVPHPGFGQEPGLIERKQRGQLIWCNAMKTCFKCGKDKPLTEYYKKPCNTDGLFGTCKDCLRVYTNERCRRVRTDPRFESEFKIRSARRKKYRKRVYQAILHMDKAHKKVHKALRMGTLIKATDCERCGKTPEPRHLHGHHADYSKPLNVEWICTTCHGKEHRVA